MNYHKVVKKLKKLEKKYKDYSFIAVSKRDVITTNKGSEVPYNNIIKLPLIYKEVKEAIDYNPLAKKILEIIGE